MLNRSLLFLILGLVAWSYQVTAQSQFAPSGAEWCLSGYDGDGETTGYVLVKYDRDSTIDQTPTKIFSVQAKALAPSGLQETYFSQNELFQQSGDSVFYYVPVIQDKVFLFKESYEVGEETVTWMYNETFYVQSLEETIIDGIPEMSRVD